MGNICRNIIASIGVIVFSQIASATPDSRVSMGTGRSAYRNVSQFDAKDLLAQAGQPAPATTPAQDSKGPPDQSSPANSTPPTSTSPTSTTEVTRPERTVPGCALKYLAAELEGKLKGRKWKAFRQEECGASTILVVFPSTIAPKYSGEKPDKARTLTCADQFTANKATNGNGGMKWIEKSGGYYSECVVRLKG
jgi:hypothetical protein